MQAVRFKQRIFLRVRLGPQYFGQYFSAYKCTQHSRIHFAQRGSYMPDKSNVALNKSKNISFNIRTIDNVVTEQYKVFCYKLYDFHTKYFYSTLQNSKEYLLK